MVDLLETRLENRWMVQPNHANHLGTTHGGNVLKWMDELGAMAAMRFAGESCVTARMDQVNFKRPIPVGDTAVVEAYVYDAGTTSIKTRLKAARENPRTGEREPTTESYSVYVAVDDDGDPRPVPDLTVDSERGRELRSAALDGER
ncbi:MULTISPECIES: acyl-CoA thioesterase [Haloarcula]|uniref:Acyl-CoA thioesterase n=1 Tax=Haloarcula pellucida TaxID=1427151 RepID=A0A830GJ99_9EURY|nr:MULTISPECIES: acyl-CoA thioesterase [Halomicroarcula]MBX0347301.1 acyl-CoA thioesterase [Halomicroarcula pellucida]MDS0276824.1 acyl-CoA thioesterase [Halomicroarcula sp. S1AR25-4]GGN88005.1 acyl-CoA thioesterase [Halomicroarcula pellucida]